MIKRGSLRFKSTEGQRQSEVTANALGLWDRTTPVPLAQSRLALFLIVTRVCMLSHFSCVRLFATLWTVARQALLSMGFSRQGCHTLLQEIFPIQGSNLRLLHWQVGSIPLSHIGGP